MRVFVDTNVLVSAFATRGLCADLLELLLLDHDLITGRSVLGELEKAMREKIKLPANRIREVVDFVTTEAALVVDIAEPARVPVDPADARVLGEGIAAKCDLFVTGDAELLRLGAIGPMKIVSPRQFWEILRNG